jgi:hypothetical protein
MRWRALETALKRGVLVIPVLVSGVAMPSPAHLPSSLKPLADRNAAIVDGGRDFHPHMEGLIRAVDQATGVDAQSARVVSSTGSWADAGRDTSFALMARDIPVAVLCIILVHYVIVAKLDLDTLFLRLALLLVPFVCAVFFYRKDRPNTSFAVVTALSIALIAVACMAVILGLSFGQSIFPATRYEWRETAEYVVSIAGSFFTGFLVGPLIARLTRDRLR